MKEVGFCYFYKKYIYDQIHLKAKLLSYGHLQANDGNVDDKYIKLYYPIQSRIYTDLQYFTIYNIVIESGCIGIFKHCRTFLQPGLNFTNVCQAECSLDLDQIYLQGQLEVFPA